MPNALYRLSFTTDPAILQLMAGLMGPELSRLRGDANSAAYDAGANVLDIFIEWQDFVARYPSLADAARFIESKSTSKYSALELESRSSLPELQIHRKRKLDESRDALRNIPLPPTGPNDPANLTGITGAMSPQAGRQAIMQNAGGMCIGREHGQADSLDMLTTGLNDGSLLANGGLLFIEEIKVSVQDDLDAWIADPNMVDFPPGLKSVIAAQEVRTQPATPFTDLLRAAKAKGVKIYGIDGGDASSGVPSDHAGQPEIRDVKMNALAKDVIDKAIVKHGRLPMIASVGEAHVNHHKGGIPGIAQIMGVPGVVMAPDGKLVPQPDDPNLRGMPSREVQAFVDGYIQQMEGRLTQNMKTALGDDQQAFKEDIYDGAVALATRLVAAGTITDAASVSEALKLDLVTNQTEEYATLVADWPQLAAKPDKLARTAIKAGSTQFLDKVITKHPTALNKPDGDGDTLMHWAARMGQPDMVAWLDANGEGTAAVNNKGDQPVHAAVRSRRDPHDPRAGFQGDSLRALAVANADMDAVSGAANLDGTGVGGRTAMHWAALNNNTAALGELDTAGARTDIADSRGWTAYETAVGSTKVDAEKFFYAKGQANPAQVAPIDPALNSVEAILKSTKFENVARDLPLIRAHLEELYGNPDLRPMLDLIAKDALLPRDPDAKGGLRMYVADRDNVGLLYNSKTGKGPAGAYDDGAHIVHVAAGGARDLAGEFAHELTHAAAKIAFQQPGATPFGTPLQEAEFKAAIAQDVKAMSLIWPGNPKEAAIKERISERMATTARDYPDDAELKLMEEFAVSVPQLIAEFGSDEVEKMAPGLTRYFRQTFSGACNAKALDPKYANVSAKLDNTVLAVTAQKRLPEKPTWVATDEDTSGQAIKLVRDSYKVLNGVPIQNLPPGVTTPFLPEHFELNPMADLAFEPRMQRVDKMLRKAFKGQEWPPEVGADMMRALAIQLGGVIRSGSTLKELDAAVEARAATWIRDSKVQYITHCEDEGIAPSDLALAEAIVIEAENQAWLIGNLGGDGPGLAVEVDSGKHKAMLADLAKSLARDQSGRKANPAQLMEELSKKLAGDKNSGFYRKVDRKGREATSHVSISKEDARRVWLQELNVV